MTEVYVFESSGWVLILCNLQNTAHSLSLLTTVSHGLYFCKFTFHYYTRFVVRLQLTLSKASSFWCFLTVWRTVTTTRKPFYECVWETVVHFSKVTLLMLWGGFDFLFSHDRFASSPLITSGQSFRLSLLISVVNVGRNPGVWPFWSPMRAINCAFG